MSRSLNKNTAPVWMIGHYRVTMVYELTNPTFISEKQYFPQSTFYLHYNFIINPASTVIMFLSSIPVHLQRDETTCKNSLHASSFYFSEGSIVSVNRAYNIFLFQHLYMNPANISRTSIFFAVLVNMAALSIRVGLYH